MGAPVLKQVSRHDITIDSPFLKIMSELVETIIADAAGAASKVLDLSAQFLSTPAKTALNNFHQLYFGGEKLANSKEAINREVDALFDQVKSQVVADKEQDVSEFTVQEDDRLKEARLMFSGLQKQLETIISLDVGIREKLVPVLSSMQFEDITRQRLTHIRDGWMKSLDQKGGVSLLDLAEEIGRTLTSNEERQQYYPTVLGCEPPSGTVNQSLIFDL